MINVKTLILALPVIFLSSCDDIGGSLSESSINWYPSHVSHAEQRAFEKSGVTISVVNKWKSQDINSPDVIIPWDKYGFGPDEYLKFTEIEIKDPSEARSWLDLLHFPDGRINYDTIRSYKIRTYMANSSLNKISEILLVAPQYTNDVNFVISASNRLSQNISPEDAVKKQIKYEEQKKKSQFIDEYGKEAFDKCGTNPPRLVIGVTPALAALQRQIFTDPFRFSGRCLMIMISSNNRNIQWIDSSTLLLTEYPIDIYGNSHIRLDEWMIVFGESPVRYTTVLGSEALATTFRVIEK